MKETQREKRMERVLKALANYRRIKIIKYLHNFKEATVGEIADAIRLSVKATSKHLRVLSSVDIVESEQRSLLVYYWLISPRHPLVGQLIKHLR